MRSRKGGREWEDKGNKGGTGFGVENGKGGGGSYGHSTGGLNLGGPTF